MELNKIACMDNLEFMRCLPDSSIDLIYSDILYGTGKKFKDYQDLKADRKIIENFYIPRIKEMYRLLKPTGSIYLQMDWRISHWIRQICDDIFGYSNLKNEIIWCYRQGGSSKDCFAKKHDNILWYSKTNKYTFNADDVRTEYHGTGGYVSNNNGNVLNGKRYKPNPLGKIPEDWWDIPALTPTSRERVGYDTQKPFELMERIIKASSNTGDICADFFCGSGSFLVKSKELGREIIGCDNNPNAVEISYNRINGFIYN